MTTIRFCIRAYWGTNEVTRVKTGEIRKDSRGSLTVEALLFLIPFIIAFCTIINAARFVQAEVLIHHAITQSAKQISTYSYVLTKSQIPEKIQDSTKKSEKFKTDVEKATSSIQGLAEAAGDPDGLIEGIFSLAKSEGEQAILTQIAGDLTRDTIKKSVSLLTDNPDDFLSDTGIVGGLDGLDFSQSEWMSTGEGEKANIKIVVTYTMKNVLFPDFDFGQYEFCQSASTLIW